MRKVTARLTVSWDQRKRTYTTPQRMRILIKAVFLDGLETKIYLISLLGLWTKADAAESVTILQSTIAMPGHAVSKIMRKKHGCTMLTSSRSESCVSGEEEPTRVQVEVILYFRVQVMFEREP